MRSRYTCTPGRTNHGMPWTGQSDMPTVTEVELEHVLAPRTHDEMIVAVESSGSGPYVTLRRRPSAEPVELDPHEAMRTAELLMRAAHLATLAQQTGDHDLLVAASLNEASA